MIDIKFDGETYVAKNDKDRLKAQLERVRALVLTGRKWTLKQLTSFAGGSEAGVSARLRDLRKPRFGGYRIDRTRTKDGLHFYQYIKEN